MITGDALKEILVSPEDDVRTAVEAIDRNCGSLVLVIDVAGCLCGTVSDGDVRRVILGGGNLSVKIAEVIASKGGKYQAPITAPAEADGAELLALMEEYAIREIPLVDESGRVTGLARHDDVVRLHTVGSEGAEPTQTPADVELEAEAIVMAGGFGKRLRPLTNNTPKPMLPIGGRPLLERIVESIVASGIQRIHLTTHYMSEVIESHFGDGSEFGAAIDCVYEAEPMGTAGSLKLVPIQGDRPLLVMNGDILTRVDFSSMLAFHQEEKAALTVGVRQYDFDVPYGVIQTDGASIVGLEEKPSYEFLVNAGVYMIEPSSLDLVPEGRFDMTDLIEALRAEDRKVAAFPIVEYWLDIGRAEDYERAEKDLQSLAATSL